MHSVFVRKAVPSTSAGSVGVPGPGDVELIYGDDNNISSRLVESDKL